MLMLLVALCMGLLVKLGSGRSASTLVIIYGAYRSFDLTCPDIVKNIIEPNAPNVHIILSLDVDPPFQIPLVAGTCLDPYVSKMTIMEGKVTNFNKKHFHVKEFLLVMRAFEYAAKLDIPFDYAIKLRFDNGVNRPILPFQYLYHPYISSDVSKNAANPYLIFQSQLDVEYKSRSQRLPTLQERAWHWITASGNLVFIDASFNVDEVPVWTPYHVHDFQERIHSYVFNQTGLSSHRDVIRLIRKAMHKLKPVYMIGSTWIHYGPYDIVAKATRLALDDFCVSNWSDVGSNYQHFQKDPTRVTEAIIRLAHWKQQWNLVDLIYRPDYTKSFNDSDLRSYEEDRKDPNRHYYLVRLCDRIPKRGGCRINSVVNRVANAEVKHTDAKHLWTPCTTC